MESAETPITLAYNVPVWSFNNGHIELSFFGGTVALYIEEITPDLTKPIKIRIEVPCLP